MSEKLSKRFFWENRFLGTKIGRQYKFLADTSCMRQDERLMIAGAEILSKFVEFEKKEGYTLADMLELIKESLGLMGFANWKRNELTDLSLRSATIQQEWIDYRSPDDEVEQ